MAIEGEDGVGGVVDVEVAVRSLSTTVLGGQISQSGCAKRGPTNPTARNPNPI